jgi:N-acetylglutamate synthase-like GNAT family acetyltransferase
MPEDTNGRFAHYPRADRIALAGISATKYDMQMANYWESDQADDEDAELAALERTERTIRTVGMAGLKAQYEREQESLAPLPEGYSYDTSVVIKPSEMRRLKQSVGWGDQTNMPVEESINYMGYSNFNVGVRAESGELVGYGRLIYKDDQGELDDFMVDPKHQRQGIGKAILDSRLAMAEASGATSLYILGIEPTNTLKDYYLEQGFHETAHGALVRGPNAGPLQLQ